MQLMARAAVTAGDTGSTGTSSGGDTGCELDPLALADDERVRARAAGIIGSDTAMLVVTNRRVLVILEDDHQSSIVLPLSEVRMARWEPAAECHEDGDSRSQPDPESGAKWGSVRLGEGPDAVRLSLVVARDGERCVELIRAAIGLPPTDRRRKRAQQVRRGAAGNSRPEQVRPRRPSVAEMPARGHDGSEMSTAVITPEFDTVVVEGLVTAGQLDETDPDELDDDGHPITDSGSAADDSGSAAGAARVSSESGRHRIVVKAPPARPTGHRNTDAKKPRLAIAIAVGLGAVMIIGLIAGNKPLSGLFGCTSAGSVEAVANALASAGPGDDICVTSDLPSVRLAITKGGDIDDPVTITGNGLTLVGGITVHADNVVVSGFQILGDPKQAIQIKGNGINVENNTGANGQLTPSWG